MPHLPLLHYNTYVTAPDFLKLNMLRKLSHSNETFDYYYSANVAGMNYRNNNHRCTRYFLVEIHSGYKITQMEMNRHCIIFQCIDANPNSTENFHPQSVKMKSDKSTSTQVKVQDFKFAAYIETFYFTVCQNQHKTLATFASHLRQQHKRNTEVIH